MKHEVIVIAKFYIVLTACQKERITYPVAYSKYFLSHLMSLTRIYSLFNKALILVIFIWYKITGHKFKGAQYAMQRTRAISLARLAFNQTIFFLVAIRAGYIKFNTKAVTFRWASSYESKMCNMLKKYKKIFFMVITTSFA